MLAMVEIAGVAAIQCLYASRPGPARRRPLSVFGRQQRSGVGFFGESRPRYASQPSQKSQRQYRAANQGQQHYDNSRAPRPRKPEPNSEQVAPTTSIVVMGDGMADWLAYGLEDAFSDTPEVAIVRKNKTHSGLLRYEARMISTGGTWCATSSPRKKPNYVVMMLGVTDRQNIRETRSRQRGGKAGQETSKTKRPRKTGKDDKEETSRKETAGRQNTDNADEPIAELGAKWPPAQRRHRISLRQMGGDLLPSHRRDHRCAQEQGRAGVLGRPAVDPWPHSTADAAISTIFIAPAPSAPGSTISTYGTVLSTRPANTRTTARL